jgi:23S rRNA (guanosine2251-2'-O)-methyltransferase
MLLKHILKNNRFICSFNVCAEIKEMSKFTSPQFQSKRNIIAGRNPVIEALKSDQQIDKILLFKNASGEVINEIKLLAKQLNVPVQYVPNEKLNGLTNINHQGIVAYKTSVQYQDLQQVIDLIVSKGDAPLFLMLDGVTDVRNIGAIARSAVCCGVHAIIIPDKGVGALHEDAMKSSAGALERINICRVNSLLKAVDTLHLNGVKVFTSEMKGKFKVYELNFTEPSCIVMGSEDKGVQSYISKAADATFTIPMLSNFDSLNVSVATGMILYEAMKQRIIV